MSRIPQHFIDDLIARTDIVEVINSRVPLKKAGREYKACCPFHDEKTPSFTVSPSKQFYHCFGCGAHGTAVGFMLDYEKLSFVEAIEDLAGRLGMDIPKEASSEPLPSQDLYDILSRAGDWFVGRLADNQSAIDYLKGRGLTGEDAKTFAIGYAPDSWDSLSKALGDVPIKRLLAAGLVIARDDNSGYYDRFRGRIMFPIRDHRGRVVAFGGRIMGGDGPKYLNSPETDVFHKGRELYGLYEARQSRADLTRMLVVEGYMDVVGLAQFGVRNCVATLGTATTPDHLTRLFRIAGEVVFCFDGDRAGRVAAWRALNVSLAHIRDGRQIRFLFLPDGEDPDSLIRAQGADGFNALLDEAQPLSQFLLGHLREQVDATSLDGLARLAELAKPLVAQIPAGVYRDMLEARLAKEIGLPHDTLARHLPNASHSDAQRSRRIAVQGGRRPMISRAIGLLLQHPAAATGQTVPATLSQSQAPGMAVFVELLEECVASPQLTTGGVLERWREHRYFPRLAELASVESLIDDAAAREELSGLLATLVEHERDERRKALLAKSSEAHLNEEERMELRELLIRRDASGDK